MNDTYRDGVGMERCLFCQSAIRNLADEPMVLVRTSDVEALACLLEQYIDLPDVWGHTVERLEHACGKTVEQINAAAREKRQGEIQP